MTRLLALARGSSWRIVAAGALVVSGLAAAPGEAASCTTPMPGGEWARYGQDLRGAQMQPAETTIGRDTVGSLVQVWKTADKGYQSPPPIVSGGCVFINTAGHIEALSLETGELVWASTEIDTTATFAVTVVDGRVHVGMNNGGSPQAAALDVTNGSLLWKSEAINFGHETTQQSSAVVFAGIQVMFTTGPDFEPTARQGYALFDAATGETLHKTTTIPAEDLEDGYAGGGVWGTPSIDPETRYLYVGTSNPESKTKEHAYDNAIIKVDLDRTRATFGQIVSSYKGTPDSVTGYDNPVCQTLGGTVWYNQGNYGSSPLCGQLDMDFGVGPTLWTDSSGRRLGVATQKSGMLHVFDADTMEPVFQRQLWVTMSFLGGNLGRIATDGETLYVPANPGVLYALDATDFSEKWATPMPLTPMRGGNAAVANGIVYYTSDDNLKALDADTGEVLWTSDFAPGASIGSGVAIAGNHIIANHYGSIAAYRLDDGSAPAGPGIPPGVPGVPESPRIVAAPGAANTGYATPVAVVSAGDPLDFVGMDPASPHDVVSGSIGDDGKPLFRSGLVGVGSTRVVGVELLPPGDYTYFCSLHAAMSGTLVVQ